MMLRNCPALESLELIHETSKFTGGVRWRKRKYWGSKLPHIADGNNSYAYFRNLHLGENKKEVMSCWVCHVVLTSERYAELGVV